MEFSPSNALMLGACGQRCHWVASESRISTRFSTAPRCRRGPFLVPSGVVLEISFIAGVKSKIPSRSGWGTLFSPRTLAD